MSEFNVLFEKFFDLKNSQNLNLQSQRRIQDLEEAKSKAGLKGDSMSVRKFDAQITRIKDQIQESHSVDYESELKDCKKEINNLVNDYYIKGLTIEDIFKRENTPKNIQEKILNEINFSSTTGYLFVNEINDEESNWKYYNPFLGIYIESQSINDLELNLNEKDIKLIRFDDELAKKSDERDLIISQKIIDGYFSNLNDSEDVSDLFSSLRIYANKFSKNQINFLYEFINGDFYNNMDYLTDFDYILSHSEDKLDESTIENYYKNLIDAGMEYLDDEYDIIGDFYRNCGDKFTEEQINELYDYLIDDHYKIFNDFEYVLNSNKDKLEESVIDGYYEKIIDNGLELIKPYGSSSILNVFKKCGDKFTKGQIEDFYSYIINNHYDDFNYFAHVLELNRDKFDEPIEKYYEKIINRGIQSLIEGAGSLRYRIWDCFKRCADKFNIEQLNSLYGYIIKKSEYTFLKEFDYIFNSNKEKFDDESFDKKYNEIVGDCLNYLENSRYYYYNDYIFDYFKSKPDLLSFNQINTLCEIVVNNTYISGFAENFTNILYDNDEKFNLSIKEIFGDIVDSRIKYLNEINSKRDVSKTINDLSYFTCAFTEKQLNSLIKNITENNNICYFANDFRTILNDLEHKFEFNVSEIYSDIIDNRIQFLKSGSSQKICPGLFADLEFYSYYFSQNQITEFFNVVIENKYIGDYGGNIVEILFDNKKYLNEDKLIEIKINVYLIKLNNLKFGYTDAKRILESIDEYADSFSESQLKLLCNIALSNDQVYDAYICRDSLRKILGPNKDKISAVLYEEVVEKNKL